MDRNKMKDKIVNMLLSLFPDAGVDPDILEYINLIEDLGMDSITFISVVVKIEELFEITVPDDMLVMENFQNVDGIVKVIEDSNKGERFSEGENI